MKIVTKDFQILKGEHTFEFKPGITVLQGPSASGKSSLIYALKYCLTNPNGVQYCINHDAKKASVTVENNGQSVTWIRTDTTCEYVNNNTNVPYVKASKLDSRDVADLGFYFDPHGKCINIHDEWSVLFPYGLNDAELFKLFEDIFSISCSYQIIDDIKKDEQQIKSDINALNAQIDIDNTQLNVINNILNNVDDSKIDTYIQDITDKELYINELNLDIQNLTKYTPYLQINVPEKYNVEQLNTLTTQVKNIQTDLDLWVKNIKYLTLDVPELKTFDNLHDNIYTKDYNIYVDLLHNINQYEQQLQVLDNNYKELQDKLNSIKVCPTCGRPLDEEDCCI